MDCFRAVEVETWRAAGTRAQPPSMQVTLHAADRRPLHARGHDALRVHGEMKDVRLEKVLRAPFPDDLEAVHERIVDAALALIVVVPRVTPVA